MSYATLAEARAAGVPGPTGTGAISDADVQAALDLWSDFMDRVCRQWFESRSMTLDMDGNDSHMLFLPVPIISVTSLYVNGDFTNVVDPSRYKVYNGRTYGNDDRRNPKIQWASAGLGIYDMPRQFYGKAFLVGTQNQRIVGTFGFTEADGSTPKLIKRAVLKLAINQLKKGADLWDEVSASPPPGGAVQSETTDGHSISYAAFQVGKINAGTFGISGDQEVERIIKLYMGPPLLYAPKSVSWFRG